MTNIALMAPELSEAPKLRLVPSPSGERDVRSAASVPSVPADQPVLRIVGGRPLSAAPRVLVAGRSPSRRAEVLADLSRTMPPSTEFEQATAFWEVLVRAPTTSMVILAGELDELPAESVLGMLAHRHPGLPVVSLEAPASPEQVPASG